MSTPGWRSTGHQQRVDDFTDRVPDFDPRSGDHLWTVVTMYRVDPRLWGDPAHLALLDAENLLSVAGPGCFYCERVYTPTLAARRCPGRPPVGVR